MDDLSNRPETVPEPANLRFLRRLVTTLTAVMILGVLVVIALLVIRLQAPGLNLPDEIALPGGEVPLAYTQGRGWYAVVTEGDEILIFDATSGELRQRIAVTP